MIRCIAAPTLGGMTRLLVLVPLLLSVLGCSLGGLGGLVGEGSAPDRDICDLLTTGEVESYWGWRTKAEPAQGERGPTCGWRDIESSAQETAVRLNLSPVSAIPCDQLKDSLNSTAVDGVGEWAYWSEDRQKMYVKKGGDCLEVIGNVPGNPDIDYMANLTALARLAAGRL